MLNDVGIVFPLFVIKSPPMELVQPMDSLGKARV